MEVKTSSFEIIDGLNKDALKKIELAGRTCYKSEDKITEDSANSFVKMLLKRGHESVLEHHSITVKINTDRATTHQLVRHRLASYSQVSQRYVNYSKNENYKGNITFVDPEFRIGSKTFTYNWYKEQAFQPEWEVGTPEQKICSIYQIWEGHIKESEETYTDLILEGASPEDARSILPNCTETEIVVTANIRQWRHIFKERCSPHAQHNIRNIMKSIRETFNDTFPGIFITEE